MHSCPCMRLFNVHVIFDNIYIICHVIVVVFRNHLPRILSEWSIVKMKSNVTIQCSAMNVRKLSPTGDRLCVSVC